MQVELLGTLVITVVDTSGRRVPEAEIGITREWTRNTPRPKCTGGMTTKAGQDGTVRLERMKAGLYSLRLVGEAGDQAIQVTVHPNTTAEITLTAR
jgi:hypothetical protein